MGDTQKIKRKAMYWRILKVLFYVVGLPLLVYLVKEAAESYPTTSYLVGNGQLLVQYIAIALVAIFAIQILLALVLKSKKAKAIIVSILALSVTIAPIAYSEIIVKDQYNTVRDEIIETYGTDIGSWEKQIYSFESNANNYVASVEEFCDYFYIDYTGKSYGKNTDGSEVTTVTEGTSTVYLSANGMYADGYVFGYEQAREIMETYYGVATAYAEQGLDVEDVLAEELESLYSVGSDYYYYCIGKSDDYISSADEWELAYGENGTAVGYSLIDIGYDGVYSYEKLDEILGVLGTAISESKDLNTLLGIVGTLLPTLAGLLGLDEEIVDLISGIDLQALLANPDLCIADVEPLLAMFGLDLVTLFDLLYQYSNYQSPTTYSVYHFIEDDDLQAYAFAKYYGLIHGSKVGSVLVSAFTVNEDGTLTLSNNVGEVSFDSSGNEPLSWEKLQATFEAQDIYAMYVADIFPYLVARNYFYIFSGIVALGIIFSYYCAEKEKYYNDKLVAKKGGK